MKQYTDVTVLLDRSGSMESIKTAMESAFAEFLLQYRTVPSTRLTLVQFDSENDYEPVYIAMPVHEAHPLVLVPRMNTPLLDAFCRTIDATGIRLASMPEADRPDQVLFVIITDGQENASRIYTRADVRRRVTTQAKTYGWQFVYLGANQDVFAEAASFGIRRGNAMGYWVGQAAVRSMGASVGRVTRDYVARASAAVMDFDAGDRADAHQDDDEGGNA